MVPMHIAMVQDGYLRMIAYIERCIPNTAPRTAEEAEAARLADWQTIQAAATPTLLPSLKFHDLVFGSVLGEGAFSTVKYARHITKVRVLVNKIGLLVYTYSIYLYYTYQVYEYIPYIHYILLKSGQNPV